MLLVKVGRKKRRKKESNEQLETGSSCVQGSLKFSHSGVEEGHFKNGGSTWLVWFST